MKKELFQKIFVYFLSVSFLLMMIGFPAKTVQAKESLPIGGMVSKGDVKFEARDKVWKNVDPSHFPIFEGVKIKTEKGTSVLALSNNCQIELGEHTLFAFDRKDRINLIQGSIDFRIPAAAVMEFKIGNIFVLPSHSLLASRSSSAALPKIEEVFGSILIHSNGAATLTSSQGSLSILSQDRVVLATLSPRDSVTIPSVTVKSPSKVMVAQAGETAQEAESKEKKRTSTWLWVGGGIIAAGVAAGLAIGLSGGGGGGHGYRPICR